MNKETDWAEMARSIKDVLDNWEECVTAVVVAWPPNQVPSEVVDCLSAVNDSVESTKLVADNMADTISATFAASGRDIFGAKVDPETLKAVETEIEAAKAWDEKTKHRE